MYILAQDNDGHWYVIPEDKQDEFYNIISGDDPYSIEDQHWVDRVGGNPSNVKFPDYIL